MTNQSESNQPVDDRRERLIAAVATLLATEGAAALTARRVAAEASTSTMGVYSIFGSMSALVDEVVRVGFAELAAGFAGVPETDDPIADIAHQSKAYLEHARLHPALYAVMFGTVDIGRYRPRTPENLAVGRGQTLDLVARNFERAVQSGRVGAGRASTRSIRWWTILHGYVVLETSSFISRERGTDAILVPLLTDFLVGEGDLRDRAMTSIAPAFA